LLQNAQDIDWEDLGELAIVSLSAGASAPEILVAEIIEAFRSRYQLKIDLAETVQEHENFLINRQLRDVLLTRQDMAFVNG